MKIMEKELSSKESLTHHADDQQSEKRSRRRWEGFQLLLMGWWLRSATWHYTLEKIGYETPQIVWLLIIPANWAASGIVFRKAK